MLWSLLLHILLRFLGREENSLKNTIPFLQSHDRRALVLENGLVRVDAHVELTAELSRLQHSASVAMVEKVPAPIDPDPVLQDLGGSGAREDLFF
jgi:hypothetical protein